MEERTRAEQRQFGRRKTILRAIAKVAGRPPAHCIMRDLSEGGAYLEFGCSFVPTFKFTITVDGFDAEFECEVRHQAATGVGVYFVSGDPSPLLAAVTGMNYTRKPPAPQQETRDDELKPVQRFDALSFRKSLAVEQRR